MIQPSPAINHVDSGRENPVHVFYRFSQTREIEPEAVRVDAATRSFGCSAARPLCLVVVRGVPVQDAIAEAELTELFEVFSSINEAWEGLDKGGCQRCWSTLLTRVRRGCLLGGLAAETPRRMIVIRWQIVPFRDRVRRGGAVGVSVLLADPGSPGSVSGRGSTTDGHSVR